MVRDLIAGKRYNLQASARNTRSGAFFGIYIFDSLAARRYLEPARFARLCRFHLGSAHWREPTNSTESQPHFADSSSVRL